VWGRTIRNRRNVTISSVHVVAVFVGIRSNSSDLAIPGPIRCRRRGSPPKRESRTILSNSHWAWGTALLSTLFGPQSLGVLIGKYSPRGPPRIGAGWRPEFSHTLPRALSPCPISPFASGAKRGMVRNGLSSHRLESGRWAARTPFCPPRSWESVR
jgi:hypothetical protein